ncbi:ATP-binding protein [Nocardioides panaciterrulae]|uniref:histidine kinase n=1 Tax=Nocardioides panaciterrulae TaxID=661492 RepID=A0A7Y9E3D7_9ACTN|nr:ATP-binding protein [Nocardioides panaciterrulae]NYD40364.1 signal transduction histidine kinase [Nocardioides panaciterrulae]
MTGHPTDVQQRPAHPSEWYDASREALQTIAEGVTQLAGFGVAAISVARDDGRLEVMAVAGNDEAHEQLLGTRTPIDRLESEIAHADEWGLLRFVPHERLDFDQAAPWGWVPDITPIEDPDAWHPLDLLIAPLYDEQGVLRGTLAIDLPEDGRRPGAARRQLLQRYAEMAGRAVVTAIEREKLSHQVRLAETAREVVRNASAQLRIESILGDVQEALVHGFQARGMWIQTLDEDGHGSGLVHSVAGPEVALTAELRTIAESSARRAWEAQRVAVVQRGRDSGGVLSAAEGEVILAFLDTIGISSLLFVPLGAGPECLGNLVLTRTEGDGEWSSYEQTVALDIGHDLGRAILNARTFEREHQLVEELQALDTYKSQLITTVAHELKNPLTAVMGHLEMLESSPDLTGTTRSSLQVMERAAQRLGKVIDDLLLLSKVGDPTNPVIPTPVDLRAVVEEAVELSSVAADRKHVQVNVQAPPGPLVAMGDRDELDRVCTNLVSNAVKYTPEGGHVLVRLDACGDELLFSVTDDGLGISEQDQGRLFEEFFRSTNPEAAAQPGTGLGLAIVQRIVRRHGGRIDVDSELGRGSTFRVLLPLRD